MKTTMENANVANGLNNAIDRIEEGRRRLVALYLGLPADDPDYERAVAETIVPGHLRDLSDSLHSAYEFLLNLRDELTGDGGSYEEYKHRTSRPLI